MKKFFHYLGNVAEIIIAFYLYGLLQNLYFLPVKVHERFHLNWTAQIWLTALITVLVLWLSFKFYKQQLREVNDWGFNQRPHWSLKRILTAFFGLLLIVVLGGVMLQALGQGKVSANQEQLNSLAKQSGQLFKIMVVFIAPACEEVIFRGMFFNTFFTKATRLNKWAGILASGFVFAYLHDPHFTKFILIYWVLGCVLAWVYMSTKDLRYSMLTHMCYNALGFI
ncbi:MULTISPECIES: type II CAAX endopeptidase family protein [Lactobacillus]|uniref:CPBP family intramembrane metalloprotease n=1 Tax=Lactobacillus xujianguonis TaxID=2495899 RepID=A0A437SWZ1_9LACO|nr:MULTISPECIES: type II CAAX endopeptidase family protein [Lactobacillus]RVU71446.1 CPBP family intramembrane metalloprotease [Lactobacillus xujianguonis]RVU72441.1 CPBP family intramembrane metalloprotease [Lactobacillus xujianguonis]